MPKRKPTVARVARAAAAPRRAAPVAGPPQVVFLNARTCGLYKDGGTRYKTDPETGLRTDEIDNELAELVDRYLAGQPDRGIVRVPLDAAHGRNVIVPTYYDHRYEERFEALKAELRWGETTIGALLDDGTILRVSGHGSPSNDQRTGTIPYIKVSDIRGLRINTNPTNLVSEAIARRFWGGEDSGLKAYDLITPNRASSNIGEFAMLLPGEERVVLTKEMFIFRVNTEDQDLWTPFSLFWALCLRGVREQWRRIALMQTNREDCGDRFREIRLPLPPNREAAEEASKDFETYFSALAAAKTAFLAAIEHTGDRYIASVRTSVPEAPVDDAEAENGDDDGEAD